MKILKILVIITLNEDKAPIVIGDAACAFDDARPIQLKHSVIKGYHRYKICPSDTTLTVSRDFTEELFKNSGLVSIPSHLKDVNGQPVGHVPKELTKSFLQIIDAGGSISAISTGEPRPSFHPWAAPPEIGGGIVIPCNYTIIHSDRPWAFDIIQDALGEMPQKDVMKLV